MIDPLRILAIDIGSGTQDIFLFDSQQEVENSPQLVLPSPTSILARKVREATQRGVPIHLSGYLMGGGPVSWAIKEHLNKGFVVTAEPHAALTLHDDLDHVGEMGVRIGEGPVQGAEIIPMGDIQRELIDSILADVGIPAPSVWCVAVQDHGHQPKGSNRAFRFEHWKAFLDNGGSMEDSIYSVPPAYLTRMHSVLQQVPQGWVMDTGLAAIHGALCDPEAASRLEEGIMVVNLGNQHVLAALVLEDSIVGIFEHHTGALSSSRLSWWLERFRRGEVESGEVLADGGHGCAYRLGGALGGRFRWTVVTGPRRHMASTMGWRMAAPFGNMMLSGCFGLVRAYLRKKGVKWPIWRSDE